MEYEPSPSKTGVQVVPALIVDVADPTRGQRGTDRAQREPGECRGLERPLVFFLLLGLLFRHGRRDQNERTNQDRQQQIDELFHGNDLSGENRPKKPPA
jgi:hypothetical protein